MSAPFRLTIIGAGSVGFTRKLVSDILCVPEFAGVEIALTRFFALAGWSFTSRVWSPATPSTVRRCWRWKSSTWRTSSAS